jgi:hypothetical protein
LLIKKKAPIAHPQAFKQQKLLETVHMNFRGIVPYTQVCIEVHEIENLDLYLPLNSFYSITFETRNICYP